MTAFILIAAAMVAVALACVLVPLLKRRHADGMARAAMNVAILREQITELDADVAAGTMPRERYEEARRELERRVLEDASVAASPAAPPSHAAAWTAATLAGSIPIVALLLYVVLGSHEAFLPAVAKKSPDHEVTRADVEAMAAKLAARLQKEPENVDGWVMLARTYDALDRHSDAVNAFERAVALAPTNAALLADYADSIGAAEGGLQGKALDLVDRALKADPTQWKALALAGTAAFDRKDYQQAVVHWEKLKSTVPPSPPIAGSIDASIAEARSLGGLSSALAATAPSGSAPANNSQAANASGSATAAISVPVPATASASAQSAVTAASVTGTVNLAPHVAAKALPTDTVFVFARATEGPKMPLAILRKQVKDLPLAFTLDDTMAMAPNLALSKFPSVIVVARVSKSGSATSQSGDLEGSSQEVRIGAKNVAVVIDRALP